MQSVNTAAVWAAYGTYWVVALVIAVITVVAMWKVFTKAGEAGWKSLIPFYNSYILFKMAWNNIVACCVFIVTSIAGGVIYNMYSSNGAANTVMLAVAAVLLLVAAVLYIVLMFKLAKAFGKGTGFGFGLWILNFIFMCILAFGSAKYVGEKK